MRQFADEFWTGDEPFPQGVGVFIFKLISSAWSLELFSVWLVGKPLPCPVDPWPWKSRELVPLSPVHPSFSLPGDSQSTKWGGCCHRPLCFVFLFPFSCLAFSLQFGARLSLSFFFFLSSRPPSPPPTLSFSVLGPLSLSFFFLPVSDLSPSLSWLLRHPPPPLLLHSLLVLTLSFH